MESDWHIGKKKKLSIVVEQVDRLVCYMTLWIHPDRVHCALFQSIQSLFAVVLVCHEVCDSRRGGVLTSARGRGRGRGPALPCPPVVASDCLPAQRLCYYCTKRGLHLIIIGGKRCRAFRLAALYAQCGVEPTQWLPVTTSFCLSKTVQITPIIVSLQRE